MFNVAVLKMKDIRKYGIGLLGTMAVVVLVSKSIPQSKKEPNLSSQIISENSMLGCLEQTATVMTNENEEQEEEDYEKKEEKVLQSILKTQISSIQGMELAEQKAQKEQEERTQKEQELEMAQTGLSTEITTNNPIKETYHAEYGKVKIKNETDYELTRRYLKTRYYNR